MIRHIVMWKFKNNEKENMKKFLDGLKKLDGEIDVIKHMEIGVNINEKNEYDACLILDVETMEDLKKYQEHPKHKEVSNFCKEIREARGSVDYII